MTNKNINKTNNTNNKNTSNNNSYVYNAHGVTIKIKDKNILSQSMEIIKDNKTIGFINENVYRNNTDGSIIVYYDLNGDLFDKLNEAIETLLYNIK